MTGRDEIAVQALREARVHVVRDEPGRVVLQMVGRVDEVYFMMTVDELAAFAARLTADAAMLAPSARPARAS